MQVLIDRGETLPFDHRQSSIGGDSDGDVLSKSRPYEFTGVSDRLQARSPRVLVSPQDCSSTNGVGCIIQLRTHIVAKVMKSRPAAFEVVNPLEFKT